ncbi:MAG: ABC transporter permease [Bacteroidota bacterium]
MSDAPYHDPPAVAMRLLRWFCDASFMEEIEGDLFELFQEDAERYGLPRARRRFLFAAVGYLRPYFFGKNEAPFPLFLPSAMIQHHVKVSFRHLYKQRFYSLINILGLAVGLACCLLILLFVRQELSYDQHYTDGDRIYRVLREYPYAENGIKGAFSSTPLAETLVQDFPEVVNAARIAPEMFEAGTNLVRTTGTTQNRYEERFIYTDPALLDLFGFPMVEGHAATALTEPFTVILTASKAQQFFPGTSALGQTLILNNNTERPFTVTGVMEDLPENTHFQFDYLLSMEGLEVAQIPNWRFTNYITYIQLAPGTDPAVLEAKLPAFLRTYKGEEFDPAQGSRVSYYYRLQPLHDIHLAGDVQDYWAHGDRQYVWLFSAIAVFILLLAGINFVNLYTARSANRAKEIGLRKVMGSQRGPLVLQHLTESVLVSGIAFVVALLLVWTLLPVFNGLTGQALSIPWGEPLLYPPILAAVLGIGVLAGLYPALFLSGFQPIRVLKGTLSGGSRRGTFRSALVVFQFATSIVLIIGSLVMWRQMGYIQSKNLGYEKEQLLLIEDSYTLGDQVQAFKSQLSGLPNVASVAVTGFVPVDGYARNGSGAWPAGTDPEDNGIGMAKWFVDHDYVRTMGMQIIDGRDFSQDFPSDSAAIILNQRAAELLGFTDPVGERVSSYTRLDPETGELVFDTYTVIGVVEDFHFESLKRDIGALSLVLGGSTGTTLVKTRTEDVRQTLADVEAVWASFAPNQPFRYNFLDERFEQMYTFEQRVGRLFGIFTGLALFVACLGLFALATFMAEQRSKEISIRKVLGASAREIVVLLTGSFTRLVVIALVIASPVAWLLMGTWLEAFAYRTAISWDVYLLAGAVAVAIAVLTISYQAIKAALVNPATLLRSE